MKDGLMKDIKLEPREIKRYVNLIVIGVVSDYLFKTKACSCAETRKTTHGWIKSLGS